jgi:DNA polymerase-1
MPERTLLLVDGANLLYRAFFAIEGLATRAGRPTNAVYGFIRTLRQLERLWKPTHRAVAMDGGVPRDRLDRLSTYKANRPPAPEPLRQQFEPLERYLKGAAVAHVRIEGVEADDVIASLVSQAGEAFEQVLIATSDKDIFETVTEKVAVVSPAHPDRKMGPVEVLEKTGVPPERIVEWLALTGDSVDNVPGVPGFGPKTAAKLLAQHPSLTELLERPDQAPSEKMRALLAEHRERILLNMAVLKLRRDIAGLPSIEELRVRPPDPSQLVPFFEEMEFRAMAEEMRSELPLEF